MGYRNCMRTEVAAVIEDFSHTSELPGLCKGYSDANMKELMSTFEVE